MRALFALAALVAPLALGACATGKTFPSYQEELDKLSAECMARGGILTPIAGATGPRAANDYACEIRGGGSGRIN